ncbi:hypothetical protein ASG97_03800 [Bacillus sp. Soil745]|nr:hypothetical protein ASG97_03800 [Bacillus sp. Soil745]
MKKLQAGLIPNMFKTSLSFKFFSVILKGLKRCATLLLAETPQAHALMRLGRQWRRGIGFRKSAEFLKRKTEGKLALGTVYRL